MSQELKDWLHSKNIPTSRTSPYNPAGNGQCERYNGTIWKAITLACKSKGLDIEQLESVLPDSLHSIRSLLCTSTNSTPHERIFNYVRRSSTGQSIPSWLTPGPILLKRHVRRSKYDPLIDEVELLDANPSYAHVKLQDGRETTVSLRDLAPCAHFHLPTVEAEVNVNDVGVSSDIVTPQASDIKETNAHDLLRDENQCDELVENNPELRRSKRISRPPKRFDL